MRDRTLATVSAGTPTYPASMDSSAAPLRFAAGRDGRVFQTWRVQKAEIRISGYVPGVHVPESVKQLQAGEVIAFLSASPDKACAVIHPETEREVKVYAYGEEWVVRADKKEPPAGEMLRALKSLRVKHGTRPLQVPFGPRRGKVIRLNQVEGRFADLPSAAAAALGLVQLLAGIAASEWLCVTVSDYDQREPIPRRPDAWPPAGGGSAGT